MPVIALAGAAPAARASVALAVVVTDMRSTHDPSTNRFTYSATISLASGDWTGMELEIDHEYYRSTHPAPRPYFYHPTTFRPTGKSFVSSGSFTITEAADLYTVGVYSAVYPDPSRTLLAHPDRIPVITV